MPDIKLIEKEISDVLAAEAAELVDLKYAMQHRQWVLRVFVDKHGGVTLKDCERYSKRIGAVLDALDVIEHQYALEVSSPGLDRVLKKEKDFVRFSGHRIRLRMRQPIEGRRKFRGFLKGFESGRVILENDGSVVHLELVAIEEARLDPDVRI